MDYRTEQYVRLYVRDTPTWIHMPWQARVTWPLLMRKMEREGKYDLGPWGFQGLADDLRIPLDVADAGVTGLLLAGVLVRRDAILFAPNFYEAQNAQRPQTNAERQHNLRERRKIAKMATDQVYLPGTDATPIVTDVTDAVTQSRNALSAVQSIAVPIQGESLRGGREAERAEGAEPPPVPPKKRSQSSSRKRPALTREELLELVAEDIVRLRAELHVDPLEAVDSFLGRRRKRMGTHETRAAFREWVRTRVKMRILEPQTNGHHTMSPPKKRRDEEPPLDVPASAAAARTLLDKIDPKDAAQ